MCEIASWFSSASSKTQAPQGNSSACSSDSICNAYSCHKYIFQAVLKSTSLGLYDTVLWDLQQTDSTDNGGHWSLIYIYCGCHLDRLIQCQDQVSQCFSDIKTFLVTMHNLRKGRGYALIWLVNIFRISTARQMQTFQPAVYITRKRFKPL